MAVKHGGAMLQWRSPPNGTVCVMSRQWRIQVDVGTLYVFIRSSSHCTEKYKEK